MATTEIATDAASSAADVEEQTPQQTDASSENADASSAEPSAAGSEGSSEGVAEEVEEEEEETCGFCIFMKAGGCKDAFNDWSNCVDKEREGGGDFTEECKEMTFALRDCMLKNREYYAPVLEEEDAFVEEKEAADDGSKIPESTEPITSD